MGNAYVCGMCGYPIIEGGYVEGYHNQSGTWDPLHGRCAGILKEMAYRIGRKKPMIRDGFDGVRGDSTGVGKGVIDRGRT